MAKGLRKGGKRGVILIAAGVALVFAALCLMAYNAYEGQQAGAGSAQVAEQLEVSAGQEHSAVSQDGPLPTQMVDGCEYVGVLRVPSLGLELSVLSEWSYAGLRAAPCLYAGSAYSGDMVVAAHNYASHFGKLRGLAYGSEVSFTDVRGNVFVYEVSSIEVLGPFDVEAMTESGWDLTLFTCTLGGGSRVAVRCSEVVPAALA